MSRGAGFAVWLAAPAALCAFASPALAYRPSLPRLTDLTAGDGRVSFRQPDGTYTLLDLPTGDVAERGGDPPEGWLPPPQCEVASSPCAFPGGVVALHGGPEGVRLEGRTASGPWVVALMRTDVRSPARIWETGGMLLVESPAFGTSTLECVDVAAGRSLWVYFYPSPLSGPGPYAGPSTIAARAARDALDRHAASARHMAEDGHPARIVRDPDPLRARAAARWRAAGWALLLAILVAALRFLPRGEDGRGGLAVAIVAATAVLVLAFGFVDDVLAVALGIGFLVVIARGLGAARGWSRFLVWAIVVLTVVLLILAVLIPSLIR